MKNTIKYLVSLLLVLWSFSLFGQVFLDKEKVKIEKKAVSNEDLSTILNTVDKALKDYESAAPLLDKTNLEVTENSIQTFEKLFDNSAKVLNDLRGNSRSLINYSDYASYAYNYLKSGILTKLTKANLVTINKDGDSYQAGVIITKEMRNGLDAKNRPVLWSKPVVLDLLVIYDIQEDNLNEAKISKISRYDKPKKDRKFFFIPSGRFGFEPYKITSGLTDLNFSNSSGVSFGIQFGYQVNDNLAVFAGIFNQSAIEFTGGLDMFNNPESTQEDYEIINGEDNNNQINQSTALTVTTVTTGLSESLKISALELSVGVRYYTGYKEDKLRFFGEAAIVLDKANITSIKRATGTKSETAELNYGEFQGGSGSLSLSEIFPERFRNTSINGSSDSYTKNDKPFISGIISGGGLYSFSESIGLELALGYYLGGSVLENEDSEVIKLETEDPTGSFIKSINKNGLSARIGLNIAF